MNEGIELDITAEYAVNLSLVEIGIGSLIHASNIPFGGQILSINQGLLLTHVIKLLKTDHNTGARACMNISTISALFKSLSPAGKKLGPMLSISAQGFLFSIGIFLGGSGLVGVILGISLLSIWAFIQPFITLYLFFGHNFIEAIQFYLAKMEKYWGLPIKDQFMIIIGVIFFKMVIASLLSILVFKRRGERFFYQPPKWTSRSMIEVEKDASNMEVVKSSLKDIFKPFFLFSFLMMMVFFIFNRNSLAEVIWMGLRPLAIAFLFFFLSRHPLVYRSFSKLRKKGYFPNQFKILDKAKEKLKNLKSEEK